MRESKLSAEMLGALAEERRVISFATFFDRVEYFAYIKLIFTDHAAKILAIPFPLAYELRECGCSTLVQIGNAASRELDAFGTSDGGSVCRWRACRPAVGESDWDRTLDDGRRIVRNFEMHLHGEDLLLAFEVQENVYSAAKISVEIAVLLFGFLSLGLGESSEYVEWKADAVRQLAECVA